MVDEEINILRSLEEILREAVAVTTLTSKELSEVSNF